MGLRKANKNPALNTETIAIRRNETFMNVAGRLLKKFEETQNPSLLIEAQKLLEFVSEEIKLRNTKSF